MVDMLDDIFLLAQETMAAPHATVAEAAARDPVSWWIASFYLLLFAVGLACSSFFSGVETATYSTSRLRLMVRENTGDLRATLLHRELANMNRLISTLLIGNNAAINLVSFGTTAFLTERLLFGDVGVITLQAILLTPILVLVGEILPKEYCRLHAEAVLDKAAPLIVTLRRVLTWTGILPLVNVFAYVLLRLVGNESNEAIYSARARMAALMREGIGTGLLSENQIDIVDRALHMQSVWVRETMTPWSEVVTLRADLTRREVQDRRDTIEHSRYPVVDHSGRIIGVVSLLELLIESPDTKVGDVVRPVAILRPRDSIHTALEVLRSGITSIAIVGTREQPVGLVSRKDLLDPLIGVLAAA